MSSVNKVILVGRLGDDPKISKSQDGGVITRISIATSESWKDKNTKEKRELTEWHRVVFFGKLAEISSQYLQRGSQVYIEGKLKTSRYTDKEGIERYATDIVCSGFDSKMVMLGGSTNSGQSRPYEPKQNQSKQKRDIPEEDMGVDISDDLPF